MNNYPFYGRRYDLEVLMPPNSEGEQEVIRVASDEFEPEALRVTFDVQTVWYEWIWYADIVVYNADRAFVEKMITTATTLTSSQTAKVPIEQGMVVKLSAGYQSPGKYGVIWEGPVFQALFERENVTDNKLTLHCALGLDGLYRSLVTATYGDSTVPTNQKDVLLKIAGSAFSTSFSANIKPQPLSRGKVVFGNRAKYFSQIAQDNNMQWFLDAHGLNLARIDDGDVSLKDPVKYVPFNPDSETPPDAIPGIIGVPRQTQYGVDVRLLLDPDVKASRPACQVNLDLTSIVQMKKQVGEYLNILDHGGNYAVYSARYIGDTRGAPWYTDVSGVTTVNGKLAMAALLAASLNSVQ